MLKKIFVVVLAGCFLSGTVTAQVTGYAGTLQADVYSGQAGYRIQTLKQCFIDINTLGKELYSGSRKLTELLPYEVEQHKTRILFNLDIAFAELNMPWVLPYVQIIRVMTSAYSPKAVTSVSDKLFDILESGLSAEEKKHEIITGLTIIGSPVGIILTVLSWIPYFIALFFEDIAPIVGLIFYAVSVIMTGTGWSFIL